MKLTIVPHNAINQTQWHDWFAWYPVETQGNTWVWLETVCRKYIPTPGYTTVNVGRWEHRQTQS